MPRCVALACMSKTIHQILRAELLSLYLSDAKDEMTSVLWAKRRYDGLLCIVYKLTILTSNLYLILV